MPDILTSPAAANGTESMPTMANDPVKIGDWLVDPRDDSLARGTERVKIEPRTMRLLMRLAQSPGTVVSQEELLESVWSGVVVGTASIYQSMSQLRKVLGDSDDPPRYIETVARKGYRVIAPVTAAPPAATRAPAPAPDAPASAGVLPAGEAAAAVAPARPQQLGWVAIAAAAALAVMAAVWRFSPQYPADLQPASIAVLPFVDLTTGGTEQAFCDGLTEETSNWLAQIPTLRVVARTTAFSYRGRESDVRKIGRELNISHVLEGSLRRSGERMRITVQLIDTRSGYHLWSGSYNVESGDVLQVQEEVARAVAGNLELRMTPETDQHFAGRRSANSEAQRLYLIARSHEAKLDGAANAQAIQLYRQAIEADPGFALAKIWLARALVNRRYFDNMPIEALAPEIEQLLADAAKDAPQVVDLYVVRGGFLVELRRREAAMRDLQRALEMSPNSVGAASMLGFYHLTAAEPRDALTYYTMASGLDPRDYATHGFRCRALTDLAQFEAAASACERARALEPESPWVYNTSGEMEAQRGRLEEALKWNDLALERGRRATEDMADRARWLLNLGLVAEAGVLFDRAFAADAAGTRNNRALVHAGTTSAVERGGAQGLEKFIRDRGFSGELSAMQLFHLGEAALIVGDAKRARAYVDRALTTTGLQPEDLASPWNARTGLSYLLVAAAVLRATGDEEAATLRLDELSAVLDRMAAAGVQTFGLHELRAKLAAMRGQGDAAVAALRRASELGWSAVWEAEHEPYLASLREREDFRELLAAVRARNAVTAAKLGPRLTGAESRSLRRPLAARTAGAADVPGQHHDVEGAGDFVSPEGHEPVRPIDAGMKAFWNPRRLVGPVGVVQQFPHDSRQRLRGMDLARQRFALALQEQQLDCGLDVVDRVVLRIVVREVRGPVRRLTRTDDPVAQQAHEFGFDEPGVLV